MVSIVEHTKSDNFLGSLGLMRPKDLTNDNYLFPDRQAPRL